MIERWMSIDMFAGALKRIKYIELERINKLNNKVDLK